MKKKKKRGEGEFLDEGHPYVSKIFAKFSHDAPLPMVKKKHLTVEQLNARRRKVWLTIAKKEIPKVSVHASDKKKIKKKPPYWTFVWFSPLFRLLVLIKLTYLYLFFRHSSRRHLQRT